MSLYYDFLSKKDMDQIDNLKKAYGGAAEIEKSITKMRQYQERKKIAQEKGFGEMLEKGEEYAKSFAKVDDFIEKESLQFAKSGVVTTQVSGWIGRLCP